VCPFVKEIFPCGQGNFPLDYRPLYQESLFHLDTTIPINSFCPLEKREGGGSVTYLIHDIFPSRSNP
jgi:hypothetical protein